MAPRPKAGPKSVRDALRHEVAAAGGALHDIAAELRARLRMRPREAWRQAHGWTLQEAADRLNELGAERPGEAVAADASLLGKWEKWPTPSSRRPSLNVLMLMASAYGCEVEDLLDLDDRQALPERDLRLLQRNRDEGSRGEEREAERVDDEPSASPRHTTGTQPCDPGDVVREAAEESADWAQWAETSNVGDIAIEQLMAEIRTLARDYLAKEPMGVFTRTRRYRDRVFALLEGRQHPCQSADLYAAAGYLCGLLAWMSSDLGRLDAADTQGRTAWLCAELAGHNDLRAWVLSTRSKIAFWDGRLKEAVTHARRGATYRPGGSAGVLLACQEADAWSQLGADAEAKAALNRAAEARDRSGRGDEIGGLLSCPEPRRANYAAAVLLRGGEPGMALREAEAGLSEAAFTAYGTLAQTHISQASAHVALRCPDGAAEALRPVLALPPDRRLEPVVQRVRELAGQVARSSMSNSAIARSLRDEIEAFCVESVPRQALGPSSGPE